MRGPGAAGWGAAASASFFVYSAADELAMEACFLNESIKRNNIKRSPFHPFSVFDTVSIGGIFTGQTVLARVAKELGFEYENELAHSASYDSEITAKVFCKILNKID